PSEESPIFKVVVKAIKTGIKADAKDVALANPRCIKMLNIDTRAMVATKGKASKPMAPKVTSESHCAAPVLKRTVPSEIPIAKTIIVPQLIVPSTSFQVKIPIFGVNITAKAINVIEDESNGCKMPSVAQNINSKLAITISRHSNGLIGPSLSSSLLIISRPPEISSVSALKNRVITKYSKILIIIENGAA